MKNALKSYIETDDYIWLIQLDIGPMVKNQVELATTFNGTPV